MTLDSLKRTSTTLVSLRKFQLRSAIDDPALLFARARLLVRPLIEEFNQQPALTYQRIKSYLDDLDGEYVHIRSLSIMLVIAKAYQLSDTTLEPILAALITAQRIQQFKAQRAATRLKHPDWITHFNNNNVKQYSDVYTQALCIAINQPLPPNQIETKRQHEFSFELGLNIAHYIAEGFSQTQGLVELTQISRLLEKAPGLNHILAPLLLPTSAFWSRAVLNHQGKIVFLLYATVSDVKIATRSIENSDQNLITVEPASHRVLYGSPLGRSQVGFKIWLKALLNFQQQNQDNKQEMALPEYPIQRPPSNLLNIVHALHKPSTEPSTIASLIEQSSFFSKTLQQSAQQLNRMSIPVHDVKQSILTHGMERIGIILTEQVLWSRLTHASFPLKKQFQRLVELHRFVASSISHANKQGLPQHASLLATLQLSFLFTHAPLRILTNWHDNSASDENLASLITDLEPELPLNSALALAKAWHQPADIIKPLRFFNTDIKEPLISSDIKLLKLSLHLSRTWMNGCEFSADELQSLLTEYAQLKLTEQQLITIRANAAEFLHCPLQ